MTTAAFIEESIDLGLVYGSRGLVHYRHGEKHGGMQADVVLKKEARVLHLD